MPKHGVSNNPLGDLPREAHHRRGAVEDDLARIGTLLLNLEELSTRIDQAIQKPETVRTVLSPARERVGATRKHLEELSGSLREYWDTGQRQRWK